MARVMSVGTTALYRTLVTTKGGGQQVYGPYDQKNVNRNYDWHAWDASRYERIQKQELKPVFHLTPDKGLVLGLEWVTYKDICR